ncbi:MAG: aspartate 1-decarboxylase, partial [Acidobacteriota bacterium]|nr:aspartate 1-decarboxylase [Acidobacteriota bacterium]
MFRKLLKSKIHRATVTRSDLNYEGSIAVDADLLQAADIQPFEAVHVWNVTNGSRLQTYAIAVGRGTGEICLNGAAARLAQAGDLVIIASFAWLDEKEAAAASPKLVFVDPKNRIVETTEPL